MINILNCDLTVPAAFDYYAIHAVLFNRTTPPTSEEGEETLD